MSRVQLKATPLPGSDYINASFVDVSILTSLTYFMNEVYVFFTRLP